MSPSGRAFSSNCQIKTPDDIVVTQFAGDEPTKARKQIQTKDNHRLACIAWLKSIMSKSSGSALLRTKSYGAEAASKWPGTLSEREFARCRRDALAGITEEQRYIWGRPGPKRKRVVIQFTASLRNRGVYFQYSNVASLTASKQMQ